MKRERTDLVSKRIYSSDYFQEEGKILLKQAQREF